MLDSRWTRRLARLGLAARVVVAAVGLGMAWHGVREKFEEHLDRARLTGGRRAVVERLGQVGHLARGLVVALGLAGFGVYSVLEVRYRRL